ncbi:MAG: PAS domain-containing protein [Archangiaceae bacterium]|nr:PAS domain-containing protein [Archangiaceae bacterium]
MPADRTLLDALPTAVLRMTQDGVIVYANPRASRLLGDAQPGDRVNDLLSQLASHDAATDRESPRRLARVRRPDGTALDVGFQAQALDGAGGREWAVVFQDLSDVQKLRSERDRLLQLAAVGDVMPTLLHEFKNPLAAITTAMELLIEESVDTQIASDLHAVLQEVRRLTLTLDGVGRLGQSLRSAQYSAIDHCAREAFAVLTRMGKEKGLTLVAQIPTLPLLPIDVGGCRALVFNLVMNAIRACASGDTITLSLELQPKALLLTVKDTGSGMTSEVLARCRELFFTTRPRGSGIGLALCQSLVDSAAGELNIASQPGQGTTVAVTIPFATQHERQG